MPPHFCSEDQAVKGVSRTALQRPQSGRWHSRAKGSAAMAWSDRLNQGGEREGLDQAAADLNGAPDWFQARGKRLKAIGAARPAGACNDPLGRQRPADKLLAPRQSFRIMDAGIAGVIHPQQQHPATGISQGVDGLKRLAQGLRLQDGVRHSRR